MSKAVDDVVAERNRQKESEGWTTEHDDQHQIGSLAIAGACYAAHASTSIYAPNFSDTQNFINRCWPWDSHWWKPKSRRRDLVRSAALIIAEIERLDRAEMHVPNA
jgi:hypothetical protein